MKKLNLFFTVVLSMTLLFTGCASLSKAFKGGGKAAGGAAGAVIGRSSGLAIGYNL